MQASQPVTPERFGRYVLLDRIGEGGMAEVFRAIMPGAEGFKRTLVVKRIHSQHGQSARFVDMFVHEARIGAMLNHPNIVQVYDFGNVDGHFFLAMEYLCGRDVLAIIRRLRDMKRPFPISIAAHVAHEVAGCLGYAHALASPEGRSLDIVHRDVSPSNVMCLREGGVKLLDFGIAKAIGEEASEDTGQGNFKGKLPYMAPERMRDEPIDGRSDLYSLGVVLWEMLTRRRLFRGDSEVETFKNILEMPVQPPSSQRPDVPASLDAIVMRALDRDPNKRYASGQAMADDLEEVLRETKFQSRMLPKLLVDLFGSGLRSRQIALSGLTSELLSATGSPEISASGMSMAPLAARKSRWGTWLGWGAVAGVVAIAALVAFLGLRGAKTPSPSPPTIFEPAPLPEAADPVATPVAAPPAAPVAGDPGILSPPRATKSSKAGAGRRSSSARARADDNPIGSGLSIDPFAEAAARGRR